MAYRALNGGWLGQIVSEKCLPTQALQISFKMRGIAEGSLWVKRGHGLSCNHFGWVPIVDVSRPASSTMTRAAIGLRARHLLARGAAGADGNTDAPLEVVMSGGLKAAHERLAFGEIKDATAALDKCSQYHLGNGVAGASHPLRSG